MTPQQFVQKWSQITLKEISVAQSHFHDVCALIGHATPLEADPRGEFFTFEAVAVKSGVTSSQVATQVAHQVGGNWVSDSSGKANVQFPPTLSKGRADVWFKGHFIWEYKGAHADLDKAYQQLLLYRESLGNPPLLITSDTQRILLHTNFTNTVKRVYPIGFDAILSGQGVDLLRRAFTDPESFRPDETQEAVTRASADAFVRVARTLQTWAKAEGREEDPERLAHFLIRLLFALFAEDMKLLPESVFSKLVETHKGHPAHFHAALRGLFTAMRDGQMFGFYPIRHFNGGLFEDDFVPDLPGGILHDLAEACAQNWASLEPSIFGTLFERVIDESKRAQLGAHYTSKDDIMLIVEPVLMHPLREEWQRVKRQVSQMTTQVGGNWEGESSGKSNQQFPPTLSLLRAFAAKIAATRVLDPACGSGNFLYVALRQLLDLQKEVITFAHQVGGNWVSQVGGNLETGRAGETNNQFPPTSNPSNPFDIPLTVSPHQLYGIEINPYAHELAQITVWIGYLQWRMENGFADFPDPVLRPLKNIENKDAILAYNAAGEPVEPEWPEVDVVIGNPPFLGAQRLRRELGDIYVESLFRLYGHQVVGSSDLVCYWFEKARKSIEKNQAFRAGLLATQSIRIGGSRRVLENIKNTGDIFMAWSDRPWVLDGASVRVSIVGFDKGNETRKILDGKPVRTIFSNLTSQVDVTTAIQLVENKDLSFKGIQKNGPFEIPNDLALNFLHDDPANSNVVKIWINGIDITHRMRNVWIIDFGADASLEEASRYKKPFEYIKNNVAPERANATDLKLREQWWIYGRARSTMREALNGLERFIVTPRVAKHRLFVFLEPSYVPDGRLYVFARDDNYFFGILQSHIHEVWALATSSRHGDGNEGGRPTYNNTTCFETFPFPWPPGQEPTQERRSSGETFSAGNVSDERRSLSDTHEAESERRSFSETQSAESERRSLTSDPIEEKGGGEFESRAGGDTLPIPPHLEDELAKVTAIADAARQLDAFRTAWLFPPAHDIGVTISASMLNKRTLTNLYNALTDYREKVKGKHRDVNAWYSLVNGLIGLDDIETLDHIHHELDRAVLSAYGWPSHLSEEEILGRLLALNLRRAGG